MDREEWADIKGYEEAYQISNLGRVKSLTREVKFSDGRTRTFQSKIIPQRLSGKGYLMVSLWKHHEGKRFLVHRLVAEAFIPNPSNLPQVNHKDENKVNNTVSNLEWCTSQYNNLYSHKVGVVQLDEDNHIIKQWNSIIEAANELHISASNISMCCSGVIERCKGFKWQYLDTFTNLNR